MARKPNHAELEGFTRSKPIYVNSWPLDENQRMSVATGSLDNLWVSTARIKNVGTGEYGPVIGISARVESVGISNTHKILVKEMEERYG